MASLHSALQSLGPINFNDIPSDPNARRSAIDKLLADACLLVESVPFHQPPASLHPNGDSNNIDSNNNNNTTDEIARVGTITSSSAQPASPNLSADFSTLQKEWGKPVNKLNNHKENPLQIPVYKLGAKDGKGAWFARRSVHEGLPFETWRAKLKGEFEETMKLRRGKKLDETESLEKGKIRGLGCERRIEEVEVFGGGNGDGEGEYGKKGHDPIGVMEVYHLSARFPGPASPRDFVALLLTSDVALDVGGPRVGDANGDVVNSEDGGARPPRHFMVVSKPCQHPDAAPRQGYIRGQYESVEFIRELPSASDSDGKGGIRPVEWTMITRSDPGGSVPKWMVERGTPPSIVGDAMKFMDWASKKDVTEEDEDPEALYPTRSFDRFVENGSHSDSDDGEENERLIQDEGGGSKRHSGQEQDSATESDSDESEAQGPSQFGGLLSSVASRFSTHLERFAPQSVLGYVPGRTSSSESSASSSSFHSLPRTASISKQHEPERKRTISTANENGKPSRSSSDSFASADSRTPLSAATDAKNGTPFPPVPDEAQIPTAAPIQHSTHSSISTSASTNIGPPQPQETKEYKKLEKLAARKREAEEKLAASRTESESLKEDVESRESRPPSAVEDNASGGGGGSEGRTRTRAISFSSNKSREKSQEKDKENPPNTAAIRKRASTLSKNEIKLLEQIKKIETDEQKVVAKIEAKRRKEAANEGKVKAKGEIEGLKGEVKRLKGLVADLRGERETWIELVGKLQKENAMLVAEREGKGGGG
ncbi:hypothetical protein AJ79_01239 [Helicocarpus griseus UAMH5409]|uniref:DUF3074 domain-containing protein n=1 Tax=Helicocarpus griseus UAMH5409 TaxID=1447875 RepID=A0A2B7Y801_9EURO|nr:hypothetical protein AJ79_01239 [Helicocarpus griseus UAMH5409]